MLESPVPGAIVFAIMLVFLVIALIKFNSQAERLNGSTRSDDDSYARRDMVKFDRDRVEGI